MDEKYMKRAIELAGYGEGSVSPNPLVGCVVVKDGRIVAEGYHKRYGGYHAERNALTYCDEDVTGADLYVTLEPCCHTGKTPPCTDIIIEKGIKNVYVGTTDPNPMIDGGGIEILKNHGISVTTGIMEKECKKLNEIFFHYITTHRPYVAMKYAMTLDGKISAYTGDAKWITGEPAREHVHKLRRRYSAILVGIGTVLADDPMLNCRIDNITTATNDPLIAQHMTDTDKEHTDSYDPVRIILDSRLRIPQDSQIVSTASDIPTIVAYNDQCVIETYESDISISDKKSSLKNAGIELVELPLCRYERPMRDDITTVKDKYKDNTYKSAKSKSDTYTEKQPYKEMLDISKLMEILGKKGIDSVLVEGGTSVHGSFFTNDMINRVYAYIAPKLIGGKLSLSPVGGEGAAYMRDAHMLKDREVISFGDDILITGTI